LAKLEREVGWLFIGVIYGLVFGLIGNFISDYLWAYSIHEPLTQTITLEFFGFVSVAIIFGYFLFNHGLKLISKPDEASTKIITRLDNIEKEIIEIKKLINRPE
jgi:tetrahydromethanopterin S-methyltransferase subunit G